MSAVIDSLTDASGDAAAGTATAAAEPSKPRKPRKPSKHMQLLIAEAREYGYTQGMNRPRDPWPGAISAGLLALAAFGLGAWIF